MSNEEQIKNIIAFLSIIFGESVLWKDEIMNFTPVYLIEKFNRYIEFTNPASNWGLHPSLRHTIFERYCDKWKIPYQEERYIS